MSHDDEQLSRLLKSWPDIEPRGNFEANVHRRLRQPAPPRDQSVWAWLPQPAFALTAAVIAGIGIGIGSSWLAVPPQSATEQLSFLAPSTLAGSLHNKP